MKSDVENVSRLTRLTIVLTALLTTVSAIGCMEPDDQPTENLETTSSSLISAATTISFPARWRSTQRYGIYTWKLTHNPSIQRSYKIVGLKQNGTLQQGARFSYSGGYVTYTEMDNHPTI